MLTVGNKNIAEVSKGDTGMSEIWHGNQLIYQKEQGWVYRYIDVDENGVATALTALPEDAFAGIKVICEGGFEGIYADYGTDSTYNNGKGSLGGSSVYFPDLIRVDAQGLRMAFQNQALNAIYFPKLKIISYDALALNTHIKEWHFNSSVEEDITQNYTSYGLTSLERCIFDL